MSRRNSDWVLEACVLAAAAGLVIVSLVGCASPRVPAELPKPPDDYPCTDGQGRRFDCSADEWLFQQITKGSGK